MKFQIRFTVDELALGPVLAALNSHDGVVFSHLAIEPLTPPRPAPKPAPKRNEVVPRPAHKPKVSKALTGREIIRQLLAETGPQNTARIKTLLVSRGFVPNGVSALLTRMRDNYKEIDGVSGGTWSLVKSKE